MNPSTPETLQLRDIHLPGPADFWPPAPGWWFAAIVAAGLLIWIGMLVRRSWKLRRQRKHILALLDHIEHAAGTAHTPEFLAQLSHLMRRIALMRFPRAAIAPLTGREWLKFLDESGGNGRFCNGPGELLAEGPYTRNLPDRFDTRALTSLIRDWIKKNTDA